MKFERTVHPFIGRWDAAAFAGVLFLLVLFLLLHSSLLPVPGVRIRLPETELTGPPGLADPAFTVAVDRFEQYYYEHQLISPEQLRMELARRAREHQEGPVTLVVYADEEVRQAATVRLAVLARHAGIRDVLLVSRPALPSAPAEGPDR